MTKNEVMQMALQKMKYMLRNGEWYEPEKAIEALEAALAQPEPDPVAQITISYYKGLQNQDMDYWGFLSEGTHQLYTAPPQRKEWVGLTDEEVGEIHKEWSDKVLWDKWNYERAIESKLKEKNT